jgi:hypothetical protein
MVSICSSLSLAGGSPQAAPCGSVRGLLPGAEALDAGCRGALCRTADQGAAETWKVLEAWAACTRGIAISVPRSSTERGADPTTAGINLPGRTRMICHESAGDAAAPAADDPVTAMFEEYAPPPPSLRANPALLQNKPAPTAAASHRAVPRAALALPRATSLRARPRSALLRRPPCPRRRRHRLTLYCAGPPRMNASLSARRFPAQVQGGRRGQDRPGRCARRRALPARATGTVGCSGGTRWAPGLANTG